MVINTNTEASAILGVDVGGTKTRWVLYEKAANEVTHTIIADGQYVVVPPLRDVKPDIAAVFRFTSELCARRGFDLSAVGIGFPRRFGNDYIIKPNYAPRPAIIPTHNEYDGRNIYEILRESIPEPTPLTVLNDAAAHLEGIISRKLNEADGLTTFAQKTVGLIAPGTSLGGGFAVISHQGEVTRITDGHINDMMITLPQQDLAFLNERSDDFLLEKRIRGSRVETAAVLSGRGLTRVLGLRGESLDIGSVSREQRRYVDIAAKVMVQVVQDIRKGDVVKRDEDQQWPESDKAAASATSIFFISGGMGTSPIGEMILRQAEKILGPIHPNVQLIIERDNMAPYGACIAANRAICHATLMANCG